MLFQWSDILWNHIPLFSIIDYPWTLLGPIGFVASLLSGYVVAKHIKITTSIILIAAIASVILVSSYAKPEKYIYLTDDYFLTNQATTTSSSEYTPIWVKELPLISAPQKVLLPNSTVTNLLSNSKMIIFTLSLPKSTLVTINTIYYPGWKFSIDDKNVPIFYNNLHGVIQLRVPVGQHKVKGFFTETPERFIADGISIISMIIVVVLCIFSRQLLQISRFSKRS